MSKSKATQVCLKVFISGDVCDSAGDSEKEIGWLTVLICPFCLYWDRVASFSTKLDFLLDRLLGSLLKKML